MGKPLPEPLGALVDDFSSIIKDLTAIFKANSWHRRQLGVLSVLSLICLSRGEVKGDEGTYEMTSGASEKAKQPPVCI